MVTSLLVLLYGARVDIFSLEYTCCHIRIDIWFITTTPVIRKI